MLENISGFIYYVSVTGITGQKAAVAERVAPEVARIKRHTRLPVAVGFGIREPEQAAEIARIADAAVVGSALVDLLARNLDGAGPGDAGPGAGRARQGAGPGRGRAGCRAMSWLTDYVRPKIRALYTRDKPEVPENLWQQCASCERMIFHRDLEANQRVCPHCDHHMRVGPDYRFAALFDEGSWQRLEMPRGPADPLRFRDQKKYADRLREAQAKTKAADALEAALRPDRRPAGRDRGDELRVHGRLDGHQPGRGLRRRRAPRGRATTRPSSWSPPRAGRGCRRAPCP